ncbi:MAG: hypothetical protein ACRDD1_21340 [Planctomycetia bacterium]
MSYKTAERLTWAQLSARTAKVGRRLLPTHLHAIAIGAKNFSIDIGLVVEDATNGGVKLEELARARRAYLAALEPADTS